MKNFKKRLMRRLNSSEHGQSILLLAIGFIALAAFVGLVTDISIMFVRFATLRRAVDSAAVAAAGQIREGTDYATVAFAARQYIVLHGLEPHRVWVETCETDIAEWRETNPEPVPLPADYNIADNMPETELCDWDNPRKLVRVTAQIDSETTFLRLVGIDNFVLTSSSVSETAVLDVALVLDTSESMSDDTSSLQYTNEGMTLGAAGEKPSFNNVLPGYCWYPNNVDDGSGLENWQWGGCCNDPGASAYVRLDESDGTWKIYTDGTVQSGTTPSPGTHSYTNLGQYARLALDPSAYASQSYTVVGANGKYDVGEDGIRNSIPDGNFSDLVCQPFRQVKDAARNFILRLDFTRGDRVALVGFNRLANFYFPNDDPDQPPMMVSQTEAINTLDKYVGIYTKPIGLKFDCSAAVLSDLDISLRYRGIDENGNAINPPNPLSRVYGAPPDRNLRWNVPPYGYSYYTQCTSGTNIGDGIQFGAKALINEDTIRRDAVWVAIILSDGAANSSMNLAGFERSAESAITRNSGPADNSTVLYGDFGFCPWYTFCWYRETGIAEWDNNYWRDNPTPKDLAAAGGDENLVSEPGFIDKGETYLQWGGGVWEGAASPALWFRRTASDKAIVTYNDKCLASINALPNPDQFRGRVEYCNDNDPDTRHFCLQWSTNENLNNLPEGFSVPPGGPPAVGSLQGQCAEDGHYDADDYARDQADWAGLIEIAPNVPGNFIAMFTIGFGETFSDTATGAPLLRYIADAGDNGRIDNTREQDWRDNRQIDGGTFQGKDPCEGPEFDADFTEWCGQYYYATDVQELDAVFEAIASRLFTRISR